MIAAHRDTVAPGGSSRRDHDASGFLFIARGTVRVEADRLDPLDLSAGDLVYFPAAHTLGLRSDDGAEVVDIALTTTASRRSVLEALTASLVVRDFAAREPLMVALIDGLHCVGSGDPRPGDGVISGRIATTVVSVALRSWTEIGCPTNRWLSRVDDPFIASVVDAMHADPGHPWTLESLARRAAMSRSTFAERFRSVMGRTPLVYLSEVRMDAAKEMLECPDATLAEIALPLGYTSEDGFSRAFRRHTGTAPRRWRLAA